MSSLARLLLLTCAALVLAVPAAAEARSCPSPSRAISKLTAVRASCATARRVATESAAIRRDASRFAAARRCRGTFCIVVRGWRCSPARAAQPRERCVRGRGSIGWLLRS